MSTSKVSNDAGTSASQVNIIVHLVRHAASSREARGDPPLSYKGERQCDDLAKTIERHAPFVTHILTSPTRRCVETTRRGLTPMLRKGLKFQVMPALAGREGRITWEIEMDNGDHEMCSRWIYKKPGNESQQDSDAAYVRSWLSRERMTAKQADGIREVVIVTQGMLLNSLLGRDYKATDYPKATPQRYVVTRSGTLKHLETDAELATARATQKRQVENLREAKERINEIEAERARLVAANLAKREEDIIRLVSDPLPGKEDGIKHQSTLPTVPTLSKKRPLPTDLEEHQEASQTRPMKKPKTTGQPLHETTTNATPLVSKSPKKRLLPVEPSTTQGATHVRPVKKQRTLREALRETSTNTIPAAPRPAHKKLSNRVDRRPVKIIR